MNELEVYQDAMSWGWRISPLSTAIAFSRDEQEKRRFESAKHLRVISDAIVDGVNGDGSKYILISTPPRHGKSTLVSRRTPQWFLGNHADLTVGMCGYGSNFAKSWGRLVRNDMRKHEETLGFTLAQDSKAADVWHTSEGGGMWTAGINGEITGKGADLFIIDDPIKNDAEANSLVYRDALWEWWMNTALTRTYEHSVIVVVMTRWHSDDFAGRLLSPEYPGDPKMWRNIVLPAIYEGDGVDEIGRTKGQALWPTHFSEKFLLNDRQNNMTQEAWDSLYQQKPANKTGLGAVYSNYDKDVHVKEIDRDDRLAISWSLDFNVNPMTSIIAQVRETFAPNAYLNNKKLVELEVLDEICLPNSNTPEMCQEFDARVRKMLKGRRAEIHVYGDATANRRDTRGADSDWEIVYKFLTTHGYTFRTFVTKSDPLQRDRVNAMNLALKSASGVVSMYIDDRCKELQYDLAEVRWKKDAAGNTTSQLDKADPKRTHVSDALGYLVYDKFKIVGGGGERQGMAR